MKLTIKNIFNILVDKAKIDRDNICLENKHDGDYETREYYRCKNNRSLPFFFIAKNKDSEDFRALIDKGMDASRDFHFDASDTLEALLPIMASALRTQYRYLQDQVVYSDEDTSVIIRPDTFKKDELYLSFEYKGDSCYANAYPSGKIYLACTSDWETTRKFMKAVDEYLIPRVQAMLATKKEVE